MNKLKTKLEKRIIVRFSLNILIFYVIKLFDVMVVNIGILI